MVVDYPVVVVIIIADCGLDADGHDKLENHIIGHAIAYMEAYD